MLRASRFLLLAAALLGRAAPVHSKSAPPPGQRRSLQDVLDSKVGQAVRKRLEAEASTEEGLRGVQALRRRLQYYRDVVEERKAIRALRAEEEEFLSMAMTEEIATATTTVAPSDAAESTPLQDSLQDYADWVADILFQIADGVIYEVPNNPMFDDIPLKAWGVLVPFLVSDPLMLGIVLNGGGIFDLNGYASCIENLGPTAPAPPGPAPLDPSLLLSCECVFPQIGAIPGELADALSSVCGFANGLGLAVMGGLLTVDEANAISFYGSELIDAGAVAAGILDTVLGSLPAGVAGILGGGEDNSDEGPTTTTVDTVDSGDTGGSVDTGYYYTPDTDPPVPSPATPAATPAPFDAKAGKVRKLRNGKAGKVRK